LTNGHEMQRPVELAIARPREPMSAYSPLEASRGAVPQ
jgi:hypothetical protein